MKFLFNELFNNASEKARKIAYIVYCILFIFIVIIDCLVIIAGAISGGFVGLIASLIITAIYTTLIAICMWFAFIKYFVFLDMAADVRLIRKHIINNMRNIINATSVNVDIDGDLTVDGTIKPGTKNKSKKTLNE